MLYCCSRLAASSDTQGGTAGLPVQLGKAWAKLSLGSSGKGQIVNTPEHCPQGTNPLLVLQVQHRALVPAAAMLEMGIAVIRALKDLPGLADSGPTPTLAGIAFSAPLLLDGQAPTVLCTADLGLGGLVLRSAASTHMGASIISAAPGAARGKPLSILGSQLLSSTEADSTSMPMAVLTEISSPHDQGAGAEAAEYSLHPSMLDCSIHAGAILGLSGSKASIRVPAGMDAYSAGPANATDGMWSMTGNPELHADDSAYSDLLGAENAGGCVASGQRMVSRPIREVPPRNAAARREMDYSMAWQASERHTADNIIDLEKTGGVFWTAASSMWNARVVLQHQPGNSAAEVANGIALLQSIVSQQDGGPLQIGLHARSSLANRHAISKNGASTPCGSTGLIKAVAREQPHLRLYSMLSGATSSPSSLYGVPNSVDTYGAASNAAVISMPRLIRARLLGAASSLPSLRTLGRVLITGGLGSLGLLVANWLVEGSATHCEVLARSVHGNVLPSALTASAVFTVTMADVASAAATTACGSSSSSGGTVLAAIIHAGGVLSDALLPKQTHAKLQSVLAPKLQGVQQLSQIAGAAPVQYTALFSSTAALIGPAGQSNYAAANEMMNAAATFQQWQGQSASSIMWGAWSVGMAATQKGIMGRIEASGMGIISADAGLHLLNTLMQQRWELSLAYPELVANPFNWKKLQESSAGQGPAMFELFSTAGRSAGSAGTVRLTAAPLSPDTVAAKVSQKVQAVLGSHVSCNVLRMIQHLPWSCWQLAFDKCAPPLLL